jgi:hypothetical protein
MMTGQQIRKELEKFQKYVISQARANLTRLKKNSSKNLYDSLKGQVTYKKGDYTVEIEMDTYGLFVDKGVNGVGPATKDKNGNQKTVVTNGEYSFKSKMPPPRALDKWIVKRGIAPRDAKGRFITRKSLQFLIARGIYKNGIAPSLFLTKPFEAAMRKLPQDVVTAYGIDIEAWMSATVEKINRK